MRAGLLFRLLASLLCIVLGWLGLRARSRLGFLTGWVNIRHASSKLPCTERCCLGLDVAQQRPGRGQSSMCIVMRGYRYLRVPLLDLDILNDSSAAPEMRNVSGAT